MPRCLGYHSKACLSCVGLQQRHHAGPAAAACKPNGRSVGAVISVAISVANHHWLSGPMLSTSKSGNTIIMCQPTCLAAEMHRQRVHDTPTVRHANVILESLEMATRAATLRASAGCSQIHLHVRRSTSQNTPCYDMRHFQQLCLCIFSTMLGTITEASPTD